MAIYAAGVPKSLERENPVIANLREKVAEKSALLKSLQEDLDKKQNEGSGGAPKSNVFAAWESGDLYNKAVEKTNVVDVKGDVKGASENFKFANQQPSKPKPKSKAPINASETVHKPPSWAFAEKEKVIQKENAKSAIGSVDLESIKTSVINSAEKNEKDAQKEWNSENASSGAVSNLMNRFNTVNVDEPRKVSTKSEAARTAPSKNIEPSTFAEKWPNGEPGPKLLPDYLNDLIEDLDYHINHVKHQIKILGE